MRKTKKNRPEAVLFRLLRCMPGRQGIEADGSVRPKHFSSFPFFLCLRRGTFFPERKYPKNGLRGEGFRFPSPLKNPLSLKRPNGEGLRPLPFGNPHPWVGRLSNRAFAAKRQREVAAFGRWFGFDNAFAAGKPGVGADGSVRPVGYAYAFGRRYVGGDAHIAPYATALPWHISPSGASRHHSYASPHNPVCTPRVLASRRALGRLAEGGRGIPRLRARRDGFPRQ